MMPRRCIPNSDVAALRGQEIEAMIAEIKDTLIPLEDRWLVLETLGMTNAISDDEYDDLAFELDEETA